MCSWMSVRPRSASSTGPAVVLIRATAGAILRGGVLGVDLAQPCAHAPLPRHELALEPLEFLLAAAHELQLARDVLERLVEQPPPGVRILGLGELAADLGARGLGGHELTQLVETQVEQVAQPDQLLQPLDVRLRVQPPLALLALLGCGQEPDLLVVANRARRRARELRQLAYPKSPLVHAASSRTCAGRIIDTTAPSSDTAARHHSARCMLEMNGSSLVADRPLARPEKILKITVFGTAAVSTARTNAIEITAPVFWSITRAPAAIPRRAAGTTPIIAAVFGLLNMPEPIPTSASQSALQT